MKRSLSLIVLTVFIVLMLPFSHVHAEDALELTCETIPAALSESGTVAVNVKAKNNGDDVSQLIIKYGDKVLGEAELIGLGQERVITDPDFRILTEELGKSFELKAEYRVDGEVKTKTVSFRVDREEAEPSCELKASLDRAGNGNAVRLSFLVKNTGNTPLRNCSITDSLVREGENLAGRPFDVEAGRTETFYYDLPQGSAETVSAVLKAEAAGKDFEKAFNSIGIGRSGNSISVTLDPNDVTADFGTVFDIEVSLKNDGNSRFDSIMLFDPASRRTDLPKTELDPGEEMKISYPFTAEETGEYRFQVKGSTEEGRTFSYESEPLVLLVNGSESTDAVPLLLSVKPDTEELERPGTVKFEISVINASSDTYTDIVIYEKHLGEIERLEELPGETKAKITNKREVSESGTYEFSLKAQEAGGGTAEAAADPIYISVLGGGGLKSFLSNLIQNSNLLLIIGAVIAVIVVILIIVLIVLSRSEKKGKNGYTSDDEDDDYPVSRGSRGQDSDWSSDMFDDGGAQDTENAPEEVIPEEKPAEAEENREVFNLFGEAVPEEPEAADADQDDIDISLDDEPADEELISKEKAVLDAIDMMDEELDGEEIVFDENIAALQAEADKLQGEAEAKQAEADEAKKLADEARQNVQRAKIEAIKKAEEERRLEEEKKAEALRRIEEAAKAEEEAKKAALEQLENELSAADASEDLPEADDVTESADLSLGEAGTLTEEAREERGTVKRRGSSRRLG